MSCSKRLLVLSVFGWLLAVVAFGPDGVRAQWQEHRIRQGDGHGGWITRPALRQVLKHPDANFTMIKWKPDAEPVQPVPRVAIQITPKADDLERYAADELSDYLQKLFGIDSQPTSEQPEAADVVLLVGRPDTNPAINQALGNDVWPKVSQEGIVLKRTRVDDKPALVIGGGSSAATLRAVYELVERWGVRYLLHGDVLPEEPGTFRLPDADVVLEPTLKVRQWRLINDFACGPESWGLDENRRIIDQVVKLRFNRVFLCISTYQPFLDLEYKGIRRKASYLWYNFHYPITDDMPGRRLFGKESEFWNPDLPRGASYEESAKAGERLVRGIIDHARRRGMQCVMTAALTEFPPEFAPLLPNCQEVHQLGEMGIVPGPDSSVTDPSIAELAAAVLRTTVDTYPQVDYIALGMPEFRQWAREYEEAWRRLDTKYRLSEVRTLDDILAAAAKRTEYPGGAERAVQEAKGDLVLLDFYDRLLSDPQTIKDTRRPDVKFIYTYVAEELMPILPRLLRPGWETLNLVDYTPARIVRRRAALAATDARSVPYNLIFTLHDDNVGLLPQLTTGSLHVITQELVRYGWSGFSTRYWLIGDHDPCLAYLARAAWDPAATPQSTYRDLLRATCGEPAVDDMLTVFREVEAATVQLEWHGLGLTFPVPGMIMSHWSRQPLSPELVKVRDHYQRALAAAQQARRKVSLSGQSYADYWIGRLEFGIGYFDAVSAVRDAARAQADKKPEEALRHAEAALKHAVAALESYARVAADQSDRGAIATMAEYVYRPLKEKVAQLRKNL